MVAKGVKRSEEGAAPQQKKAKVDPKVASVKQTIESADISESCKAMYLAMLPHTLCVPKDLRSEPQSRAVDMIGEVYDAIELKLKDIAQKESTKMAEIEASKVHIDARLTEAESRHSATTTTVESCKAALAKCFGSVSERKLSLAAAEEAERTGNAAGLVVEEEHRVLTCAIAEHLKALKEGSWESGSAQHHLDVLLPLAMKQAEEGLVSALPGTCLKAPADRTAFDNMVMDQFEASLTSRLTRVNADIEAEKPAKAERAANVAAEQRMLKMAEDDMQKASEPTAAALSDQKETLAVLQQARSDLAVFKPQLKKAKESADEAQAEVDLFHENNRQHFFFLAAQTTKVEEVFSATANVEEVISTTALDQPTKVKEVVSATIPDVTIGGC
jgi:hypothetical protein